VFLLFGSFKDKFAAQRKGLFNTVQAIQKLSPEERAQLCLIIAGRMDPDIEGMLKKQYSELQSLQPVQLLFLNEYISEHDVQALFQLSDLVLIPYQRQHVGMSGVLVRAAAAGKPVLATNHGLLGALVKEWALGCAVDCTRPDLIAHAIRSALSCSDGQPCSFNRERAAEFSSINSGTNFAEVILSHLLA
jgi:glycosyltransferase involved in cell wall biosynthesis